jgi:hypothetical protein
MEKITTKTNVRKAARRNALFDLVFIWAIAALLLFLFL